MLKIHDTFTGKKVLFKPIDKNHVCLYVCGPTVYDRAHIGNARPVVVFDVLSRLLRLRYPKVTYARNITDIDDKIIKKANERGISIEELTKETTKFYHEDMASLKALPPDIEPRATENVSNMIEMIKTLLEKGYAYEEQGHVLFQVSTYKGYGQLSGRTLDEMIAGARVEVAPYKKEAADFILWKPSTEDQPGWKSPWGRGRPGWHLECSAMTKAFLGHSFDIHGGGCDLVFPHHENERAQSICSTPEGSFAKYWMHNGHLTIDNHKMSKSLGNFSTVSGLLEKYSGEVIRIALLSTHYRQPLDWTESLLIQARRSLDTFYGALRCLGNQNLEDQKDLVPQVIWDALDDDLNTPLVFSHFHTLASEVHKATGNVNRMEKASALKASGRVLGLLSEDPECWFQNPHNTGAETVKQVEKLIKDRKQARLEGDFFRADSIRDTLHAMKIELEDSPTGTTWRRLCSKVLYNTKNNE